MSGIHYEDKDHAIGQLVRITNLHQKALGEYQRRLDQAEKLIAFLLGALAAMILVVSLLCTHVL